MDSLIDSRKGSVYNVNFEIDYNHKIWCNIGGPYYKSRNSKRYPWYFYHKNAWDSDSPWIVICSACVTVNHITNANISGKTLFISSASKLSRDLIRNSGYKITYNKDKADYVVIAKPEQRYNDFNVNMLVKDIDENIYRCNIQNKTVSYYPPIADYLRLLAKEIGKLKGVVVDPNTLEYNTKDDKAENLFQVWRVMDDPEHLDILRGDNTHKYILDSDLPLTLSNKLSVETLDLWSRLIKSDYNMFEKSVMNSDVRNYPFTFYAFMNFDDATRYLAKSYGIKWLMQNMGIASGLLTFTSSPEDINLLEGWILYKLGVSETGGFVNYEDYDNLHYQYKNLIRKRLAVAPVKVTEPMSWYDLTSKAKN